MNKRTIFAAGASALAVLIVTLLHVNPALGRYAIELVATVGFVTAIIYWIASMAEDM